MEHHTDDPGKRAQDIAQREANEAWRKTGSGAEFAKVFEETLQSTLRAMQDPSADGNE